MAQAPTTEKKKRKPFTRTEKPVYVILGYRDESGNEIKLDKSRLSIEIERDSDKVMERLEAANGQLAYARVTLPKANAKADASSPTEASATA